MEKFRISYIFTLKNKKRENLVDVYANAVMLKVATQLSPLHLYYYVRVK